MEKLRKGAFKDIYERLYGKRRHCVVCNEDQDMHYYLYLCNMLYRTSVHLYCIKKSPMSNTIGLFYITVAGSLLHTPLKWLSLGSSDTGHG